MIVMGLVYISFPVYVMATKPFSGRLVPKFAAASVVAVDPDRSSFAIVLQKSISLRHLPSKETERHDHLHVFHVVGTSASHPDKTPADFQTQARALASAFRSPFPRVWVWNTAFAAWSARFYRNGQRSQVMRTASRHLGASSSERLSSADATHGGWDGAVRKEPRRSIGWEGASQQSSQKSWNQNGRPWQSNSTRCFLVGWDSWQCAQTGSELCPVRNSYFYLTPFLGIIFHRWWFDSFLLAFGFCRLFAFCGFWLLVAFGFWRLLAFRGFWLLVAFGFWRLMVALAFRGFFWLGLFHCCKECNMPKIDHDNVESKLV